MENDGVAATKKNMSGLVYILQNLALGKHFASLVLGPIFDPFYGL